MGREQKQGGGGRGEEAKVTLSRKPRALIGADGSDVRQLLVNMYYECELTK